MEKVFAMNKKILLGISGLNTDIYTLRENLESQMKLYTLREGREMTVRTFNSFLESTLYAKRFGPYFVEPIVCGLEGPDNKPFISALDSLGCSVFTKDYAVVGTAESELYGTCETLYRPDLEPEDLFETLSQCLLAATDRDCLSGYGGVVYILTPEKLICRHIKGRQD